MLVSIQSKVLQSALNVHQGGSAAPRAPQNVLYARGDSFSLKQGKKNVINVKGDSTQKKALQVVRYALKDTLLRKTLRKIVLCVQ